MSENTEFTARLDTKNLASGYEAELKRGDGTSVTAWGATEEQAEENLKDAVEQ